MLRTVTAAARRTAGFPAVMALGILSVGAEEVGRHLLSLALAAAAAAVYAAALPIWVEIARHRKATPESFAAVAATAVLGTRVALGHIGALADVILSLAVLGWIALWPALHRARDLGDATGTRLLLVVATQSLVVLGTFTVGGLAPVELALFVLGALLYPLLLVTIPPSEWRESSGDVWIEMGALAISALAAARLATLIARAPMRDVSLVLWGIASVLLPLLVAAELRWPRPRFHARRWGTVFPLGMYAATTIAVAHVDHVREPAVAQAALWAGLAVATLTTIGAVRAGRRSTA